MVLFGGSGLLGTRIRQLLFDKYSIIAPTHKEVDVIIKKDIDNAFDNIKTDVILYAAGIANVEAVEADKKHAMEINREAVSWIAKRAARQNIPVVYISTDAVFKCDQANRPYKETDKVSPLNYYGLTKAEGEKVVLSASDKNLVIRLITLYSSGFRYKLDFARSVLKKLFEEGRCYGICDQYCNPTFVDDAVNGLSAAIEKKISGILHLGATNYMTNYEFVQEIAVRFGYAKSVVLPITLSNLFKGRMVKRGRYTWLDTTKAQRLLGKNTLHTINQSLNIFHAQILNSKTNS